MKNNKGKKKERFEETEELIQRIQNETPEPGEYFYDYKL